jgi:hypothetical protein
MADLYSVPDPEPADPLAPRPGWTPERYRKYWSTILGVFAFTAFFALLDILPTIAFVMITLLLVGFAAAATVLRVRQLNRDRDEWR